MWYDDKLWTGRDVTVCGDGWLIQLIRSRRRRLSATLIELVSWWKLTMMTTRWRQTAAPGHSTNTTHTTTSVVHAVSLVRRGRMMALPAFSVVMETTMKVTNCRSAQSRSLSSVNCLSSSSRRQVDIVRLTTSSVLCPVVSLRMSLYVCVYVCGCRCNGSWVLTTRAIHNNDVTLFTLLIRVVLIATTFEYRLYGFTAVLLLFVLYLSSRFIYTPLLCSI